MFKRLLLSLMIVAGLAYGAEEAVSMFNPKLQAIVDGIMNELTAVRDFSSSEDYAIKIKRYEDAANKLKAISRDLVTSGAELIELEKLTTSYARLPETLKEVALWANQHEADKLYWANVRSFVWDMFNPYAYADAVQKTWQAGWGNMMNTLWTDHKSVLAGTALITTAAGLFVAYKKGCFSQQKEEAENE